MVKNISAVKKINKPLVYILAILFAGLLISSFLVVNNKITFIKIKPDEVITRFEYRNGNEVGIDKQGNEVVDLHLNNIIKWLVLILTVICFWQLVLALLAKFNLSFIQRQLIGIGIVVLAVLVFNTFVPFLSFAIYGIEF